MFPIIFGGINRRERWNPGRLPGIPREWLAGPDWCFTDGSAAFTAANSQSLSVASNSTFNVAGSGFWVSAWAKLATVGTRMVLSAYAGGNGGYELFHDAGTWVFRTVDSAGAVSQTTRVASTGVFTHLFGWYDPAAATVNLSVSAAAVGSGAANPVANPTAASVRLGSRPSNLFYYDGNVATVAFGKSPPGGITAIATTIRDRLYASGAGIVYADTTSAERTAWGLVSWWDLVRSGNFTDSHGSNNLTNNNGVGFGAGLPRARAGDTDPVSALVDRWQGTLWSEADLLKRLVLRDLGGGRWVLRSDGVNDGIGHGPATTGARTIAMAYTQTTGSARVLQAATPTNTVVSPRRPFNANLFFDGAAARNTVWLNDSSPHVFSMQRSGVGPWRAWGDGTSLVVADTTNNFGSLGVGHFTGADQAETFTGDIYSIVDTNADISDADRAALTTYLSRLYGGSL